MYKGAGCGVHELYYIWGVACHDLCRCEDGNQARGRARLRGRKSRGAAPRAVPVSGNFLSRSGFNRYRNSCIRLYMRFGLCTLESGARGCGCVIKHVIIELAVG